MGWFGKKRKHQEEEIPEDFPDPMSCGISRITPKEWHGVPCGGYLAGPIKAESREDLLAQIQEMHGGGKFKIVMKHQVAGKPEIWRTCLVELGGPPLQAGEEIVGTAAEEEKPRRRKPGTTESVDDIMAEKERIQAKAELDEATAHRMKKRMELGLEGDHEDRSAIRDLEEKITDLQRQVENTKQDKIVETLGNIVTAVLGKKDDGMGIQMMNMMAEQQRLVLEQIRGILTTNNKGMDPKETLGLIREAVETGVGLAKRAEGGGEDSEPTNMWSVISTVTNEVGTVVKSYLEKKGQAQGSLSPDQAKSLAGEAVANYAAQHGLPNPALPAPPTAQKPLTLTEQVDSVLQTLIAEIDSGKMTGAWMRFARETLPPAIILGFQRAYNQGEEAIFDWLNRYASAAMASKAIHALQRLGREATAADQATTEAKGRKRRKREAPAPDEQGPAPEPAPAPASEQPVPDEDEAPMPGAPEERVPE